MPFCIPHFPLCTSMSQGDPGRIVYHLRHPGSTGLKGHFSLYPSAFSISEIGQSRSISLNLPAGCCSGFSNSCLPRRSQAKAGLFVVFKSPFRCIIVAPNCCRLRQIAPDCTSHPAGRGYPFCYLASAICHFGAPAIGFLLFGNSGAASARQNPQLHRPTADSSCQSAARFGSFAKVSET